ncbi:PD-(D/E)XK nuclease family protein [Spirosoma sp. SC4-14]|uniref:PD-(D/E)XK nuclease family protein n=1 Tax=Spirosoma sp. SC4-14 TaxID=3128900 RepID=UPI0030D527B0
MTFLQQTAQRIFDTHGPSLSDVWVILPTRRAVSVFLDELAKQSDRPFLAPHTLAVDDFITHAAGVQLIDTVSLLFELYEVFREIDPQVEFEQFIGWASVLLADFDRIDQYLVSPHELFSYLTAAKALERWQVDAPSSAKPIVETPGTKRYFKLFENLNTAYHALHTRLAEQGLAYRGMAYRLLAQNVETLIRDNLAYERIYFVGFNALSRAEEHIIRVLVDAQKAEMIWDVDQYYIRDREQESGEFLRRYLNDGWLFSKQNREDLNQLSNHLLGSEKNIRVIGVPNASMQAKVAGKLYADWGAEGLGLGAWGRERGVSRGGLVKDEGDSDTSAQNPPPSPHEVPRTEYPARSTTAIVLADETLLMPVLYALDESVTDLNVTMGLSLRSSLLFTLVDTLFEMQRTVHEFRAKDGRHLRIPKYHHRHVVKVLNHPFVRQYERIKALQWPGETLESGEVMPPEPLFQWIAKVIVKDQRVYLTESELNELGQNDPLVQVLFARWPNEEPLKAIQTLYDLIDLLRDVYRASQDAVEIEYLYLFFTLVKQLEATLERQAETAIEATPVTVKSFRQFLYELIRQTSIPFTSEGKSQLQIMGMLETRALDFDRVIILSVNEGSLPQSRKLNSLIPFDIASELHLPTYREQEAVMAYHFYRLLQRASDITLLYTTSTDAYGNSKGEPSRFIRQIEHELVPRSNGLIRISYPTVRFGRSGMSQVADLTDLRVPKTESIRTELIQLLTTKGLYPSYLNQFISCSMRFYFSRIVKIAEEEEIEEKMGVAEFGSWLHKVMERLDLDYRLKNLPVDEDIVKKLLEDEFTASMKGRVIESGMNLLLYDLARKLMLDFHRQQNALAGLTVIGTEQTLETYLLVPLDNGESIRVRIAGKIDRIERLDDRIRIVDYKTGRVELPDKAPKDLAEKLLNDGREDKMRQLWLYRYLALKNISEHGGLPRDRAKRNIYPTANLPVEAGFYSFRDLKGGFKSNPVTFGADDSPQQYIRDSEEILQLLIRRLLDTNEPFRKTDQIEMCQYCDFKGICGR